MELEWVLIGVAALVASIAGALALGQVFGRIGRTSDAASLEELRRQWSARKGRRR